MPHGEAILPDESRIRGEHIKEYAESLDDEEMQKRFSRYLERGLSLWTFQNTLMKSKKDR